MTVPEAASSLCVVLTPELDLHELALTAVEIEAYTDLGCKVLSFESQPLRDTYVKAYRRAMGLIRRERQPLLPADEAPASAAAPARHYIQSDLTIGRTPDVRDEDPTGVIDPEGFASYQAAVEALYVGCYPGWYAFPGRVRYLTAEDARTARADGLKGRPYASAEEATKHGNAKPDPQSQP